MNKQDILYEIKRTAAGNGGKPLGMRRFERETGIRISHWQKHWARFADAQREAGFAPNEKIVGYGKHEVLNKLAMLSRTIGRIPALSDIALARAKDTNFPSPDAIRSNLGSKEEMIRSLYEFCKSQRSFEDVAQLCNSEPKPIEKVPRQLSQIAGLSDGFVYLMKSGRYFKIGKTNSVGRREREITLQMPERLKLVHEIKTDDPTGIETYWHNRFKTKRTNGEWFDLSSEEVSAFRRRKFM